MKKRILHKLKITEVSAVDRPCQSGAVMTIMKRADDAPDLIDLEDRMLILQDRIDVALLKFEESQHPRDERGRFASGGGSGSSPSSSSSQAPSAPDLPAAGKLPGSPEAAPPSRKAWLKSALRNSLRGAVLSSAPARRAVATAATTLVNAVAPSAPFVRDTVALAAVGGVKVAGVIADVKGALHFLRALRAKEITKAAPARDPILDAINRALTALEAYERSRAPSQRTTTEPPMDPFDSAALEIRKRDGCDRTTALRRARAEAPGAYADYNTEPIQKTARDYDSLVEAEIRKGYPRSIAGQVVTLRYGIVPTVGR